MINKLRIYILKPIVSLILIITLLLYASLVESAQIKNYVEFNNRPQYYFSVQATEQQTDESQEQDNYITENIRQDPSCDPIPISDSSQPEVEKSLEQYVEKIENINFNIIIGLGLIVIAFDILTCMTPVLIDLIMTCIEFKFQVKNTQLLSLLRNCLVLNFIMMDNLMSITAPFDKYEFQHCLDPKLIWNLFSRFMDYSLYITFALAIIQLYSTFFFLILQRNRFGKLFIAFIIVNKLVFTSFIILRLRSRYKPFLLIVFLLRQWVQIFQIFKLQGDFIQVQIRSEQQRANRALQKVVN
ncbi:hypothetical protein pb186bvf_003478 [Paramecium bursaria]